MEFRTTCSYSNSSWLGSLTAQKHLITPPTVPFSSIIRLTPTLEGHCTPTDLVVDGIVYNYMGRLSRLI